MRIGHEFHLRRKLLNEDENSVLVRDLANIFDCDRCFASRTCKQVPSEGPRMNAKILTSDLATKSYAYRVYVWLL